jgi:ribonuclease HII
MPNNKQKNNPSIDLELSYLNSKYKRVVGIDEAGRGCWAGPLAFASYCFDLEDDQNQNVRDSKLISFKKRENIFKSLNPNRFKLALIGNEIIDSKGMVYAINKALVTLISNYNAQDTFFIIDGNYKLQVNVDYSSLIKGDQNHYAISCASIVAKVSRDRLMDKFSKDYPQYSFEKNKGYGTLTHYQALLSNGPCKIHRLSFKPLREIMKKRG